MAWTDSRVFRAALTDVLGNTTAMDLSGTGVDAPKSALYDNGITPDKDDTAAHSAYNAAGGAWVSASHEIYQSGQWASGGVVLASPAISNPSSGIVMFDGTDTASGSAFTTQLNGSGGAVSTYGALTYDDTLTTPVADQGICFNYFGAGSSVSGGQLTIVWHANGLFQISV